MDVAVAIYSGRVVHLGWRVGYGSEGSMNFMAGLVLRFTNAADAAAARRERGRGAIDAAAGAVHHRSSRLAG